MRVAIVHDDLMQWGGAERVLEGICQIYPDAPIFTALYDANHPILYRKFSNKKVVTSSLQKIPGWKGMYRYFLPLYPLAFEQFNFDGFDMVISQTTKFAKFIITKPDTKHICYCHTPPRFLWYFSDSSRFGKLELFLTYQRIFSQIAVSRVDCFISGSVNTQRRIKKVYKKQSMVVRPFIDLSRFEGVESFNGGYLAVIARLNSYKRVDLVVKACVKLGYPLKIIGDGPEMGNLRKIAKGNDKIDFLGQLDDETLLLVLAGAKALVLPGVEDFGITPLEAQALGKPVVAYKKGGALETVLAEKTGIFFDTQDEYSLKNAIARLLDKDINPDDCKLNAQTFSKENFINNFKQAVAVL